MVDIMIVQQRNIVTRWFVLAAIFGGGLLPGSCLVRTRQAAVDGAKSYLGEVLLNPANLAGLDFDELLGDPQ